MNEFDDGLVHGHDWASLGGAADRGMHPIAMDTAGLTTPSSVFHDDHLHAE